MSLEHIHQEPAGTLLLAGVEAAAERGLKQKLYVQQEVMKALGFLPDNFDPTNFDSTNYKFSPEKEALALKWSAESNKKGESNAEIFSRMYAGIIQEFPGKIFSTGELEQVVARIVAKFSTAKDVIGSR